ncbi:hypothetical protein CVT26_002542 [Gymnopilus dilepis]|uniref:BTB domain-containing protein n=1 Tax=Gymnopilus dilepis TaxID=231916 RepID=A0A409Y3P6_9AGAR|nr:hypothetical protein CVT26_002542 [Gymnopilus dilepis]
MDLAHIPLQSQQPGTTDQPESGNQEFPALVQSTEFWFKSGDIIFSVENKLYKVHKEILARHSSVMQDMFDLPQGDTSRSDCPTLHGCPLVELTDKAREIEYMLSLFYDNLKKHDWTKPTSLTCISTLLLMGKKYGIDYFVKEALRRLRLDHPTSLAGWRAFKGLQDYKMIDEEPSIAMEKIIQIGHEHCIESILPVAYMRYAFVSDLEKILRGDDQDSLSLDRRIACAVALDFLKDKLYSMFQTWMRTANTLVPAKGCKSSTLCPSIHADLVGHFPLWSGLPNGGNIFRTLDNEDLRQLCLPCCKAIKAEYANMCKSFWNMLPDAFLGAVWAELKDFEQ